MGEPRFNQKGVEREPPRNRLRFRDIAEETGLDVRVLAHYADLGLLDHDPTGSGSSGAFREHAMVQARFIARTRAIVGGSTPRAQAVIKAAFPVEPMLDFFFFVAEPDRWGWVDTEAAKALLLLVKERPLLLIPTKGLELDA